MTEITKGRLSCTFEEGLEAAVNGTIPHLRDRPYWPNIQRIGEERIIQISVPWGDAVLQRKASYCGNDPQFVENSGDSYRLLAPSIVWMSEDVTTSRNIRNFPGWAPKYEINSQGGIAFDIFVCATDEQISEAKKIHDEKWERIYDRQRKREARSHDYYVRHGKLPSDVLDMPSITIFRKKPIVDWYK